jgi:hypothetical protein
VDSFPSWSFLSALLLAAFAKGLFSWASLTKMPSRQQWICLRSHTVVMEAGGRLLSELGQEGQELFGGKGDHVPFPYRTRTGGRRPTGSQVGVTTATTVLPTRRRPQMSAAARKRIAAAQKKRWAEWRKKREGDARRPSTK